MSTNDVRCTYCGEIYDLGEVKVIARHTDATVFTTPCCGRTADDREWKSLPDFTRNPGRRVMRSDGTFYEV